MDLNDIEEKEILLGLLSKIAVGLLWIYYSFILIDRYLIWAIVIFAMTVFTVTMTFLNWAEARKRIRNRRTRDRR